MLNRAVKEKTGREQEDRQHPVSMAMPSFCLEM